MRLVALLGLPRTVAVAIASVFSIAIGFVPLFAGPGYELAIAIGLVMPTVCAVVAAVEAFVSPRAPSADPPLVIVLRGLRTGLLLFLISLAFAVAHALRIGPCDLLGGTLTLALGPGAGLLLSGAIGAAIGLVAGATPLRRPRRVASIVAGLAPLASALVALGFFYATPAVFAFDPFVGFFSGTLYDEVVEAGRPLLTYRAGTGLTILAIVFGAAAIEREARPRVARPPLLVLGALAALGSAILIGYGPELGHRSTAASIARVLGGSRQGPRCDVVFPRALHEGEAELLVRDCEEALVGVERRLGIAYPGRVTAFFFKDADQKRRLMGAAETYVAKPWRREVYLQIAAYPHPVLAHEIAHVVAGTIARGPFRVAGAAGGLLPNPGLIEGLAVAAAPERDELTPAQWARAMKELAILPKLSRIFGGGFLAQNSATAYTVAGAFVQWSYDHGFGEAVRAWYGGAPFEQAFGISFAEAERRFLAHLDEVPLPDSARAVAKGRFDRPAIWGRRCPHVVERLRDEAESCREVGDLAKADRKLDALLALDRVDPAARLERARLAGDRGDDPAMRAQLVGLATDARIPATAVARAREALGDLELREGALDRAREEYAAARPLVLDEDWSRNLDVKSWSTGDPERARRIGRLLAAKRRGREARDETAVATIDLAVFAGGCEAGCDDRAEEVALVRYLLARRLVEAKAFREAERWLAAADSERLATVSPRLVREKARLLVLAACMDDPATRAPKLDAALAEERRVPPANDGRREAIARLAERCRVR